MVIGPDKLRSNEMTLDLAAARKVLSYGRAGLPVVFVGDWSQVRPVGVHTEAELAEVRSLVAQIQALPTTRTVLEAAGAPRSPSSASRPTSPTRPRR